MPKASPPGRRGSAAAAHIDAAVRCHGGAMSSRVAGGSGCGNGGGEAAGASTTGVTVASTTSAGPAPGCRVAPLASRRQDRMPGVRPSPTVTVGAVNGTPSGKVTAAPPEPEPPVSAAGGVGHLRERRVVRRRRWLGDAGRAASDGRRRWAMPPTGRGQTGRRRATRQRGLDHEVIGPAGVFVVGAAGVAAVAPIASLAVPAMRAGGAVAAVTVSVSAVLSVPAVTVAAAIAARRGHHRRRSRESPPSAARVHATAAAVRVATAAVGVTTAAVGAAAVAGVSGIGGNHGDGGAAGHQECSNRPGTRGDAKFLSGQRPSPTRGETAHLLHSGTFAPPSTADR